jgi:hypothetical protein
VAHISTGRIIEIWWREAPPKIIDVEYCIVAACSAADFFGCIAIWRREAPTKN